MPTGPTDEEEADLQRAIAMSMAEAEAEAPKPESPPMKEQPKNMDTAADIRPFNPAVDDLAGPRNNAQNLSGDFDAPNALDLFDVPIDKESKDTACDGLSPRADDEENGNGEFKPGEIAAKALDLPISTSHSPQTADNMAQTSQNNKKPTDFAEENKNESSQIDPVP